MTKEEIRDGIVEILEDGVAHDTPYGETADAIMRKQDSQGVVVKVDSETLFIDNGTVYVATEPLIEVKDESPY